MPSTFSVPRRKLSQTWTRWTSSSRGTFFMACSLNLTEQMTATAWDGRQGTHYRDI